MPDDLLHQRAYDVLAQLSLISEGTATRWDVEGHGAAESREPINVEAIDKAREREGEPGPPPKSRSLYDYYAHWFTVSWRNDERLLYWVASAEEDVERRRRTGQPQRELATGDDRSKQILKMRGPAAEVAAKVGVNIAHIKTLRLDARHDPLTGDPWLWPHESMTSSMTSEAKERAKAYAQQVAVEMVEAGVSQRRVSEATGIPGRTLRRMLNGERPID